MFFPGAFDGCTSRLPSRVVAEYNVYCFVFTQENKHRPLLHLQSVVPESIVLRQCLLERVEIPMSCFINLFFILRHFGGWFFLVPVKHSPKGSHDAILKQHFVGARHR